MVQSASAYSCIHCQKIFTDLTKATTHENKCLTTSSAATIKKARLNIIKDASLKFRTEARTFDEILDIINECGRQVIGDKFELKIKTVKYSKSNYDERLIDKTLVPEDIRLTKTKGGYFTIEFVAPHNIYNLSEFLETMGFTDSGNWGCSYRIFLHDLLEISKEVFNINKNVSSFNKDAFDCHAAGMLQFRAQPEILDLYQQKEVAQAQVNKIKHKLAEVAASFNDIEEIEYNRKRANQVTIDKLYEDIVGKYNIFNPIRY